MTLIKSETYRPVGKSVFTDREIIKQDQWPLTIFLAAQQLQ